MATISSAGSGPYHTGGTWVGGVAPTDGVDTAQIEDGHTVTVQAAASPLAINIKLGGILTNSATNDLIFGAPTVTIRTGGYLTLIGSSDTAHPVTFKHDTFTIEDGAYWNAHGNTLTPASNVCDLVDAPFTAGGASANITTAGAGTGVYGEIDKVMFSGLKKANIFNNYYNDILGKGNQVWKAVHFYDCGASASNIFGGTGRLKISGNISYDGAGTNTCYYFTGSGMCLYSDASVRTVTLANIKSGGYAYIGNSVYNNVKVIYSPTYAGYPVYLLASFMDDAELNVTCSYSQAINNAAHFFDKSKVNAVISNAAAGCIFGGTTNSGNIVNTQGRIDVSRSANNFAYTIFYGAKAINIYNLYATNAFGGISIIEACLCNTIIQASRSREIRIISSTTTPVFYGTTKGVAAYEPFMYYYGAEGVYTDFRINYPMMPDAVNYDLIYESSGWTKNASTPGGTLDAGGWIKFKATNIRADSGVYSDMDMALLSLATWVVTVNGTLSGNNTRTYWVTIDGGDHWSDELTEAEFMSNVWVINSLTETLKPEYNFQFIMKMENTAGTSKTITAGGILISGIIADPDKTPLRTTMGLLDQLIAALDVVDGNVDSIKSTVDTNLDIKVSTRASQTTADAIQDQTDKLIFDGASNVAANVLKWANQAVTVDANDLPDVNAKAVSASTTAADVLEGNMNKLAYVSHLGNDLTGIGTIAAPYATVYKAFQQTSKGAEIRVSGKPNWSAAGNCTITNRVIRGMGIGDNSVSTTDGAIWLGGETHKVHDCKLINLRMVRTNANDKLELCYATTLDNCSCYLGEVAVGGDEWRGYINNCQLVCYFNGNGYEAGGSRISHTSIEGNLLFGKNSGVGMAVDHCHIRGSVDFSADGGAFVNNTIDGNVNLNNCDIICADNRLSGTISNTTNVTLINNEQWAKAGAVADDLDDVTGAVTTGLNEIKHKVGVAGYDRTTDSLEALGEKTAPIPDIL